MTLPDFQAAAARALEHLETRLDRVHPGWESASSVIAHAVKLSEGFTAIEGSRLTPSLRGELRAAYLAYFVPRTVAALSHVLSNVAARIDATTAVDVGAGSGAASLLLAAAGARSLTLFDHDAAALEVARDLVGSLPSAPEVQTTRDGGALPPTPLTVAAFAFAEMSRNERAPDEVAAFFARRLQADASTLVVVDAGDRASARALQHFRERVLSEGHRVLAPCPHHEPCPALMRERDWCHSVAPRRLTDRLAAFAQAVGRDPDMMSFSYLVVTRGEGDGAAITPRLRVIGEQRREKGRVRVPVCGPGGLRFLQALKRNKASYRLLGDLERGETLSVPPEESVRADTAHVDDDTAPTLGRARNDDEAG